MPIQTARSILNLSNLTLPLVLTASLLIAPAVHTQAQTQPPTEPPAATVAAAPPALPAPSAAVAAVIADVQAKVKAGQFADAVAALTAAKTDGLPPDDKRALDFAIADAHLAWGTQMLNANQFTEALVHLESAKIIDSADAARRAPYAIELLREGNDYYGQGRYENAIDYYQQAASIFRQVKNLDAEARALGNAGNAYRALRSYAKAISCYDQALPIFREVNDRAGEAGTLDSLGIVYDRLRQYAKAIGYYDQALPIYRELKNRHGEARALTNLGDGYRYLHNYEKAADYFDQSLPIFQEVKDRDFEGAALSSLGHTYLSWGRYEKAIGYFDHALAIFQEVKDRNNEASALNSLGLAYLALSQYEKAIEYYEQALPIYREVDDRSGAAGALTNLGSAFRHLNEYEKAISYYKQALPILQTVNNRAYEGNALNGLGFSFRDLGQYAMAIGYFEQALPISQMIKDRNLEGSVLSGLGLTQLDLGQIGKAIGYLEQALPIYSEIKDLDAEANTLNGLGNAYFGLRRFEKAIGYYEKALPVYREVKDRNGEASALTNLGLAADSLNQHRKAIGYFDLALPVFQTIKNKDYEANALSGLGNVYANLSQYSKAIGYQEQALMIYRQVKDRVGEADTLNNLEIEWSNSENRSRNPRLAILLGKMAVNTLQGIRSDNRGLDKELQSSFVKSKEAAYRTLADLLITQGRLPEAQQVLGLLKEQEFFDFVRRDAAEATGMGKADLNALEARADAAIRAEGDRVTEAGTRYTALLDAQKRETDPAKKKALDGQLDAADKARIAATAAFQKVLGSLSTLFDASRAAVVQKPLDIKDTEALTSALGTLDEQTHRRTVAVYTLVGEKTLRFLVYTGAATPVAREYPIGAEALNKKVASFRNALQDPTIDPRPLAKQLYDILIAPVKADIKGAEAGEVMWSLDGTLRYLPLAALSPDGVHYLAEQPIGESIFTPATLNAGHLTDATQPRWLVLALGVTGARTVDGGDTFPALPGVAGEIGGIVKSSGRGSSSTNTSAGIFPGTPLLDGDFTQDALVHALRPRQFPLVHIASHFRFRPGDEGASYLLLGVGKLTLTDVKDMPADLFRGVDLLTLSACDTAVGGGGGRSAGKAGDGSEVESFGVLVQKKGAEAVLATLWPVADASTPALMQAFYRIRQAHPSLPKAEALRQAQVALLTGTVGPATAKSAKGDSAAGGRNKRGDLHNALPPAATASVKGIDVSPPAFVPDPAKPWAHPYYWAPFILIGNWK